MATKKRTSRLTARTADKYWLYTEAVQSAESEVEFLKRVYRKANGKPPVAVREDFCGTAAICCEWARAGRGNIAIGVDIDPEPLRWGREHYLAKLKADVAKRVTLLQKDVLAHDSPPVDVVLALNFSYCVFKERSTLLRYIRRCRQALTPGGVLIMDLYGGPEAQKPQEDISEKNGFTYIWDQKFYNPITNECVNYIHFKFPDGSRMRKAFSYDWRLWSLRELSETMLEADFRQTTVYWEGTDKKGEGNGVFRTRKVVDVEDAWIAYIVGHA